jgi:UDP-N-acetylglucosamine--N-acetylmuramyl-(pentapeptide) pyrophosphoryl-undecaprenol N-acetylglucosamine transferase
VSPAASKRRSPIATKFPSAIVTGKLRRSPNPRELARNIVDAFRIPFGVAQAVLTVARTRPTVALSTGGYVSVPIGLAARLLRVPYLLHEQTLSLGLANRILAHFATRILLSHEASLEHLPRRARSRAVVTGNPVRPAVLNGNPVNGLAAYGLDPAIPLVLITGGAGGARQINRMLTGTLNELLQYCQIVHQCGNLGYDEMQDVARRLPPQLAARYRVIDFLHDEMPELLAAAAIVVARSGAGTVAELTALGKAAILIPYPHAAGDEQRVTARHLAQHGAAIMLDGDHATPGALHDAVTSLLNNPHQRAALAAAAATTAGQAQPARSLPKSLLRWFPDRRCGDTKRVLGVGATGVTSGEERACQRAFGLGEPIGAAASYRS